MPALCARPAPALPPLCLAHSIRRKRGHSHGTCSLDALCAQRRQQEADHDLARRAGVHAASAAGLAPLPLPRYFWRLASSHMHSCLFQCLHGCVMFGAGFMLPRCCPARMLASISAPAARNMISFPVWCVLCAHCARRTADKFHIGVALHTAC